MTLHEKSHAFFHDDSEPVPDTEYPAIARRALAAYYAGRSPVGIDLENLTVQIEKFSWQNASYRIDLFFNQKPSFLPYNSDFVMAHRMWMRRSGEIIKSEPVYRSPNFDAGASSHPLPGERRGFFPGNRAFRAELDFIDGALIRTGSIRGENSGMASSTNFSLDVGRGLKFLEECSGAIVEKKDGFVVTIERDKIVSGSALIRLNFGPCTLLEFDIDKSSGAVSPVRSRTSVPPALA